MGRSSFRNGRVIPVKRKAACHHLAKLSWLVFAAGAFVATNASADVTLWKSGGEDGWEIFTNGRVGAFWSWAKGDGTPPTTYDTSKEPFVELHKVKVDGCCGAALPFADVKSQPVLYSDGTASPLILSTIDHMRIRSGMLGNVFGFGVNRKLNPETKMTAYLSIMSTIDSRSQRKFFQQPPDLREAYFKIASNWGAVLLGRTQGLFNRGAYEADVLYLHGYGVGWVPDLAANTGFPSFGMVGMGILPAGYGAAAIYSTPALAGVQLSAGLFDPTSFPSTAVSRTKYPRVEFELAADEPVSTLGKVHLYFNGISQTLYRSGKGDENTETVKGIGYGGRVELGPVRLAGGGHRGEGLGFTYLGGAGTVDSSIMNDITRAQLRSTDGFYAIGSVTILGKIDLNAGYGISRAKMINDDLAPNPMGTNINPATGAIDPEFSYIRSQQAVAGAIVYHAADWLHVDIDVISATFKWNLGEKQNVNFYNAGTTVTW
jgi:Gram-negative porin